MFRLVPGQILAPKYSAMPSVAAVMRAKASNINQHFKAISIVDIDTVSVEKIHRCTKMEKMIITTFQLLK